MFVDRVHISVKGGDGGAGVSTFDRQRNRQSGKPSGGSGGGGGNVTVVASSDASTLLRYSRKPHCSADDGTHGEGDLRHGRRGGDLLLTVPLGTVVRANDGTMMADLVEAGQQVVVAHGGHGGRGNAAFVSTGRRAPTFAEQGEYGEKLWITLELKLIADAALIGFPNAGKSTLISRVSAAKPKIADYPFTTLEPNLGVVEVGEREFVLADIPGLVEGAAEGKGLGHEFLRHTERARALVILLDPSPLQEEPPDRQYEVLLGELAAHSPELVRRPRVVALNKIDILDGDEPAGPLQAAADPTFGDRDQTHHISAMTGAGLDELMHAVADAVETAERVAPEREGFELHRPLRGDFEVVRQGETWLVSGRGAERAINLDDLTSPTAADFAASRLQRAGVDRALIAAGAQPGDDVRIGEIAFMFEPDAVDEPDVPEPTAKNGPP